MSQKILKVGSSAAVTLSKRALGALGLKVGDRITVDVDTKRRTLRVAPTTNVDQEIIEWTKRFVDEYRGALEELAQK